MLPSINATKSTIGSKKPFAIRNIIFAAVVISSIISLYILSRYNYLLFHGTVEIFTIVITISIFVLTWNSRHIMDNNYLAYMGMAFLFVGVFGLLHTLAYEGIGVFPNVGANLATQLWIVTRYIFSLSLMIPLLFIKHKIKSPIILAAYSFISILLILSIFYWKNFPQAYIDGVGLTAFKIASEYVISLILLVSIILLVKNRREMDDGVFKMLLIAMVLGIATEMAFTLYTDVYGIANMVGHLLNMLSYIVIYKAFIETGFTKPYNLLFRNLKQNEIQLSTDAQELININAKLENEIQQRKKREIEREIIIEFLQIANNSNGTNELINKTLDFIKQKTGFETVGIRLRQGDDYHYFESRGFPPKHSQKENCICAKDKNGDALHDSKGDPLLDCMGGNIMNGLFDSNKSFFTQKGSFWTNTATKLLQTTGESDELPRIREQCNKEGYESVALIALKTKTACLGLLQFNDKQENMFNVEMIQLWENIAQHLSLALSKSMAEETARNRAKELSILQKKLQEKAREVEKFATQMEKLAEERLTKLKDSERLAAIGATAAMVGHDIRNPLQAITSDVFLAKTELSSLSDSEEKNTALESIEEIEKNVDYINKIVQDLQDYARPLNPKFEEIYLKQFLQSLIKEDNLPTNIEVKVNVDEAVSKISVDSYYLNRILYNLITNAIQAMPQGGTLTLEAGKKRNNIIISVKDTGTGISTNLKDKIFTPMFTTKSRGQGFGLPVVKRMVESLGGSVKFRSQEDKGTTFTIELPMLSKNS